MRGLVGFLLVIAVSAAVYLPDLGDRGFGASEGHRVVPAVEFAEREAWLLPTMFETVYIRKPPGMPIAIMLSSEVFGWTEFGARFVSAASVILGGAVLAGFGIRWFGARFGWSAGLAYVLAPVVIATGRAAEIEALHNLFVLLSCVLIIDLVVRKPGRGIDRAVFGGAALGVALLGTVLTKGPAAIPTVAGTVIASGMIVRRWRALLSPAVMVGVVIAGGVSAWLASALRSSKHVLSRMLCRARLRSRSRPDSCLRFWRCRSRRSRRTCRRHWRCCRLWAGRTSTIATAWHARAHGHGWCRS